MNAASALPARDVEGCPVVHTDYRIERPAFETWELLNAERELSACAWNDSTQHGFWVVSRFDDVKEALSRHEDFTNASVSVFIAEEIGTMLPQNLDQPEHMKLRRILNPFFSAAAVERIADVARARASALIADLAPRGSTEMCSEFAMRYPTDVFLLLLGLPVEDGELLVGWVEDMFLGFFHEDDDLLQRAIAANSEIRDYFKAMISERETNPRDPQHDLVSRLLTAEIDGVRLTRRQVMVICRTLLAAGLDTTRAALGYMFHHLANHPELRQRLVAHPELWPKAAEEGVRLFTLVIQDGRVAGRDIEWNGMPIKKGDKLWLGLASANRDPRKYQNPDEFDMDREQLAHHLGFGYGHHRCLGMHLARAELVIALEEWHRRIPDYRVDDGEELRERGGQLRLQRLHLRWNPT